MNVDPQTWTSPLTLPQDGVMPVLILLAACSCSVLCLDTLVPDHLHAPITFLRFPLSEGESLLPSPLSILFCLGPLRSACLAYARHLRLLPVRIPDRQETPGGGSVSCSWLCPQHPGQHLRLQSLESTSYQLQINTGQLTDASALGFLNP